MRSVLRVARTPPVELYSSSENKRGYEKNGVAEFGTQDGARRFVLSRTTFPERRNPQPDRVPYPTLLAGIFAQTGATLPAAPRARPVITTFQCRRLHHFQQRSPHRLLDARTLKYGAQHCPQRTGEHSPPSRIPVAAAFCWTSSSTSDCVPTSLFASSDETHTYTGVYCVSSGDRERGRIRTEDAVGGIHPHRCSGPGHSCAAALALARRISLSPDRRTLICPRAGTQTQRFASRAYLTSFQDHTYLTMASDNDSATGPRRTIRTRVAEDDGMHLHVVFTRARPRYSRLCAKKAVVGWVRGFGLAISVSLSGKWRVLVRLQRTNTARSVLTLSVVNVTVPGPLPPAPAAVTCRFVALLTIPRSTASMLVLRYEQRSSSSRSLNRGPAVPNPSRRPVIFGGCRFSWRTRDAARPRDTSSRRGRYNDDGPPLGPVSMWAWRGLLYFARHVMLSRPSPVIGTTVRTTVLPTISICCPPPLTRMRSIVPTVHRLRYRI
uniref:Uncharacterized protein n=1 Tax=Mycena chlorophos TaxID=658473 RepID=A0ABQ0L711_MYCCL|nr:predicted protein [Mycena chlorophos]